MRILIVTQKIDERDAVLGFMHGWIAEFSKQAESVVAICLEKGEVNLPNNVKVFSLGKEKLKITNYKLKTFSRLLYSWRFVRYIVQNRNEYDAVFVHMNPEYIVLGGIFWKLFGKTVTLWYAHKSTPWHLKVALFFTDIVFTSTTSGFRLKSKKVKVIGQGIDTGKFNTEHRPQNTNQKELRIVTVGRITPSKDYDTLIEAIEKVRQEISTPITVDIIGPRLTFLDEAYLARLKEKVAKKDLSGVINFKGAVANVDLPYKLSEYDLFVNMGHTGSLDKVVPEAMAVGLPILTCNEAFKDVLGPFVGDLMYPKADFKALSDKILGIAKMSSEERFSLGLKLRAIVERDHSLKSFVSKIISNIESFKKHE
ncbi:MAG: glycosyltransferase [Patescibacteria group bacterium]